LASDHKPYATDVFVSNHIAHIKCVGFQTHIRCQGLFHQWVRAICPCYQISVWKSQCSWIIAECDAK